MKPMEVADMIGKKVLVTTDNWFFAPDGIQYRAVYGTLVGIQTSEQALGVKVNARSQDWFMTVASTWQIDSARPPTHRIQGHACDGGGRSGKKYRPIQDQPPSHL